MERAEVLGRKADWRGAERGRQTDHRRKMNVRHKEAHSKSGFRQTREKH